MKGCCGVSYMQNLAHFNKQLALKLPSLIRMYYRRNTKFCNNLFYDCVSNSLCFNVWHRESFGSDTSKTCLFSRSVTGSFLFFTAILSIVRPAPTMCIGAAKFSLLLLQLCLPLVYICLSLPLVLVACCGSDCISS